MPNVSASQSHKTSCPDRRVVVLAMLRTGFLGIEHPHCRLDSMLDRVLVGILCRGNRQNVMPAMQDEVGAAHVLQMPLEREGLRLLHRFLHRRLAEHPLDMHGEAEIFALAAPHLVDIPDRAVADAGGETMLVATRPRRIVAAEARTADGNAFRVDVSALLQPVDALSDRELGVGPVDDAVPAQRSALSRTIDHQHRDSALQAAVRLHEPHLVLDAVEPAHADQHGLLRFRERCPHEVGADRLAGLVRNIDCFALGVEVGNEFLRARFH